MGRAPTSIDLSVDKNKGFNWRCPRCQSVQLTSFKDIRYVCLCGKRQDPPSNPYLTPHSCGEPCGKALDKDIAANASYDDDDDHCRHHSAELSTPLLLQDICDSCDVEINASCFCKKKMDDVVICGDVAVKGHVNVVKDGLFSCNSECGKTLGCGNHVCKETCHPGVCGDCELLPDMSSYISVRSERSILNLEVSSGPSRGTHYSIQSTNKSKLRLTLGRVLPSDLLVVDSEAVHHPQIGSRHRGDLVELTSGDTITLGTTSKLSKLHAPLQPDEANGKRTLLGQRKLVCDNECSKLKSKKVLADAFRVNTSVSLAYHMQKLLLSISVPSSSCHQLILLMS
ncbi:NF-X1-type zinc finger protein NFXL1 [Tanacetum coccineum]